jgi:hypothetical protein
MNFDFPFDFQFDFRFDFHLDFDVIFNLIFHLIFCSIFASIFNHIIILFLYSITQNRFQCSFSLECNPLSTIVTLFFTCMATLIQRSKTHCCEVKISLSSRMMGTSQQWFLLVKTNKGCQASKIVERQGCTRMKMSIGTCSGL